MICRFPMTFLPDATRTYILGNHANLLKTWNQIGLDFVLKNTTLQASIKLMTMHQLKIIPPARVWHMPWRWPSILHKHFTRLWILSFPSIPRSHLMASSQRWLWSQLFGYVYYLTFLLHVFASWDKNPRIIKYQSAAPRRNQDGYFSNFASRLLHFRSPELSNLRHQLPRESPKRMIKYSMDKLTVLSTPKHHFLHLNWLHPATLQ